MIKRLFCSLVFACGLMLGCQSANNPTGDAALSTDELKTLRVQYEASEEPDATLGVIELRESFPDEEDQAEADAIADPADETAPVNPVDYDSVVVVGKVGGKCPEGMDEGDFPIVQDEAVFYIADPAFEIDASHDHGEDHDCPFCNKKAVEAQAVVRFLGKDGKPLPVCAKALFELEEESLVVVSGSAAVELDTLVITADKIFVRR
jgi:hypothetical protein